MAKRKRLSPAAMHADGPLETKSAFGPPALPSQNTRAPIADVARDASAQAALEELSDTMARARSEGRMVVSLPLEVVMLDHLVRDRVAIDGAEMAALEASIETRGQQTPIEVMALENGRYGLISGWRRCQALAALKAKTGEARFNEVHALLRQPDDAAEAYLAMIEENEIRVGLSYYERARIVLKSAEQGVFDSKQAALRSLYQSASRAKRSKIGSFVRVVRALDGHLKYPDAIGERFGLALSKALDAQPDLAQSIARSLASSAPASAEAELKTLAQNMPASRNKEKVTGQGAVRKKALNPILEINSDEVGPGVIVHENADGAFALSGVGVDSRLRNALIKWLKSYH